MLLALLAALALAGPDGAGPPKGADPIDVRPFRAFDRTNSPGLPQSTVMGLAQDAEGVLWLATLDGVATFEGRAIEPLAPGPSVPDSGSFYVSRQRRAGGVHLGGTRGVFTWDGSRWTFTASSRTIADLAEEDAGTLVAAAHDGTVWRRAAAGDWSPVELPDGLGPAVAVSSREGGELWVAGRDAVARSHAGRHLERLGERSFDEAITAFLVAKSGTAWAGTRAGTLYFLPPGRTEWSQVANPGWTGGRIRCLAEDRRGRVWAGGSDGFVTFGREQGEWTVWGPANGLRSAGVMSILADREGTLWFGLNGAGLQQWVSEAWTHRVTWKDDDPGAGRLQVFGITPLDHGGYVAALFNRGVWRWDGRKADTYGRETGITEDTRVAVEPEPGTLWVGARYGLFESRRGSRFRKALDLANGMVTGLFRSPGGAWHAATSASGVYVLSGGTWKPAADINAALPDRHVRDLLWRSNGELWVATIRGVVAFAGGRGQVVSPPASSGVPDAVNCLLEVRPDELWLGGFGGIGILRGGEWTVLTPADGLPGKTIYSLALAPDGSVWAGGSGGVGRYAKGRWTIYDSRRGLIEDECNLHGLLVQKDGSVLVGTMASLARFDARVEALPEAALRVFFREGPRPGADGVARLDRRSLRVRWSAPWVAPRLVEYRTRIDGLRPEWSPATRESRLDVENLGPGSYAVQVAARLEGAGDDAWSEPAVLRFRVEPYLWETKSALLVGMAVLALAVYALVRFRTASLARRARALQEAVEREVANIKILRGLLPICAWCKKVRDDSGYWRQIESYIRSHSEADFSHGVCPDCAQRMFPSLAAKPEDGKPSR